MQFLIDLWLPIVAAAVFVFVVSSVIHMALPIHRKDHSGLPGEETILTAMRENGVARGSYMFPHFTSMKECGSPEMLAKYEQGPVGFVTIFPNGPPAMGKALGQWFAFSLVVGVVTAYVCSFTVPTGAGFAEVFRTAGTVGFIAYGLGVVPDSIWKGAPWSNTFKFVFDGLLYGLATGAAFGWLWPGA